MKRNGAKMIDMSLKFTNILDEKIEKFTQDDILFDENQFLNNQVYENIEYLLEENQDKYSEISLNANKSDNKNKDKQRSKTVVECKICCKQFVNRGNYTLHLKRKHCMKTDYVQCNFCGKDFNSAIKQKEHELVHLNSEERRKFSCSKCEKKFLSENDLKAHVKYVHIRKKSFICEECGKGYVNAAALNSHKTVHSEKKPFQCSECSKCFKRSITLKIHLESHENCKVICSICGKQINSQALLRRHMVFHSDEKKYKCNSCGKEFRRPDAFKHHLILHSRLKPYECNFCDLTFADGSNCRKHQKNVHPIELASAELNGIKPVYKNMPKIEQLRATNDEILLKPHIKTPLLRERPFFCEICGKETTSRRSLEVHKLVHVEAIYKCQICSRLFKNFEKLKIHEKNCNVQCLICNLKLKNSQSLKEHIRLHTDEKNFKCPICEYATKHRRNLKAHMLTHTGLKPYHCPFCEISYTDQSNCKKHMKNAHPRDFAEMEAKGFKVQNENVPKFKELKQMMKQITKKNSKIDHLKTLSPKNDCNSQNNNFIFEKEREFEDEITDENSFNSSFANLDLIEKNSHEAEILSIVIEKNIEEKNESENIHENSNERNLDEYSINNINDFNVDSTFKTNKESTKFKDLKTNQKYKTNNQENIYKKPIAECKLCSKKFLRKGAFAFHLKAKHSFVSEPIPCKFCGKLFKAISAYEKHESTHLPLEERKTFPCLLCNKKFLWEKHLQIHIKAIHIGKKSFICEECGKGYLTLNSLNTHKIVHSNDKPFKCLKCEKTFKRMAALKEHLRNTHTDEKHFQCPLCQYACRDRRNLKTHMLIHVGLKPYQCSFCNVSYSDPSNCKKHVKQAHPSEFAEMDTKGFRVHSKNVPTFYELKQMIEKMKQNI